MARVGNLDEFLAGLDEEMAAIPLQVLEETKEAADIIVDPGRAGDTRSHGRSSRQLDRRRGR